MSEWSPTEAEARSIFDEQIVPVVFPSASTRESAPTFVLLAGQPGAAQPLTVARILAEYTSDMAALRSDDLRAFHPRFLELARSRSPQAPRILADTTATWLRDSIVHARTTSRSLLLEGAFQTPRVALGTAELFGREGFSTRIVVVATPRSESLLSTASRYLLDAQSGRASRFTSVEAHDAGWAGTQGLVAELSREASVDRLTILDRNGNVAFDAWRTSGDSFTRASAVLDRARSEQMKAPSAMRWLSELRAMTDFALRGQTPDQALTEMLLELQRVALTDVVPQLPLPADSQARPALEASVARHIVALRRTLPERPRPVDSSGPAISLPVPDRGITR